MMKGQDFLYILEHMSRLGARVCGSFARGDYDLKGNWSDIDLVVPMAEEDEWGDKIEPTPIQLAIKVLDEFGIPWDSILPGHISTPRDTKTLPRPIEVMEECWITPDPTFPDTVKICGIGFKTFKEYTK